MTTEWMANLTPPTQHRDGIPWHEAPPPPRRHDCIVQTAGYSGPLTLVERCACGAIRLNRRDWAERNARAPERKSLVRRVMAAVLNREE